MGCVGFRWVRGEGGERWGIALYLGIERVDRGSLSCGDELLDILVQAGYGEGGKEENGKGKEVKCKSAGSKVKIVRDGNPRGGKQMPVLDSKRPFVDIINLA